MTTVIHVIEKVSLGGGTRGVLASAKYSSRLDPRVKHEIISLLPPKPDAMAMAHKIGVVVYPKPNRSEIYEILNTADIVQVDWWNSPAMTAFLNKELPASRLVIWFHVAGDKAPQIIMPDLLNLPDVAVATSWYNYDVISALQKEQSTSKTTIDMVFCGTDFERFDSLHLKQHQGFNVGYIGTVDFVKLHQNYMLMSASVDIPDIKFIVCGREIEPGTIDSLMYQAEEFGKQTRFEFKGYVHNVKSEIEMFDLYGYPLCENNYSSSELNLQEVMFAGVPAVVFNYGGAGRLVQNSRAGYVVRNESEYKEAIEYLHNNPAERRRLGNNALEYSRAHFGAENWAAHLNDMYREMLKVSKSCRLPIYQYPRKMLNDLGSESVLSPCVWFARSMGEFGDVYFRSIHPSDEDDALEAEAHIADSARVPILRSQGFGSIFHYRYYFQSDKFLRLWAGLLLKELGRYQEAVAEFESAIRLGLTSRRVYRYIDDAKKCFAK